MLSSTTSKNTYTGNGAVDTYAYGFKIFDDDDLLVTVRDTSGVETTLTKTTHYTVSGVGETSGGNVALVNGAFDWIDGDGDLKTSYVLTIRRVLTLSQDLDLRNQGSYLPEDVEDRFDKNVMIAQQQQDEVDRSVKLPETIAPSSFDPTFPADLLASGAGGVPTVNDAGTGWADAAEWPTATEVSAAQGYAQASDASADAALVSESLAEEWAIKVDGIVDSTDYSAKAWAIGGTGVTDTASRGAAKEWATETASTVDGTGYSSKEWAQGTQTRGASGGGSAKDWATYTGGTVDDTGNSAKYWAEDAAATAAGFSSDLSTHEADTTGIHGITDTANLVTKDGAETLTNKTLTTPIISTISNTGTVTLPTATTTLVGRDTTDTLTNKTLTSPVVNSGTLNTPVIDVASLTEQGSTPSTPSSGTKKFYAKTDGKVYTLNSAGEERQVGSGTGAGGKNYLQDLYDGTSVTGISTYADAAASSPVDGTGGSPSISAAALNTSTPLRGTSSQRLSKGAVNEQGEGWAIDFTVDRADYEGGKPLIIQFRYKTSASYASSDIRMFVYDRDGATLLNVQDISNNSGNLLASSNTSLFTGTFYPNSSNNDYRLIFHITSTNASAYDIDVIDLSVGPDTVTPSAIVTEPVAYTPTFVGLGSVTSINITSWRVGNTLRIAGNFTTGTCTATTATMTLGFNGVSGGLTIATNPTAIALMGRGQNGSTTNPQIKNIVVLGTGGGTVLNFSFERTDAATSPLVAQNGNAAFIDSTKYSIQVEVPIASWAASAAQSTTEALFSTAKAAYSTNAGQSIPNTTVTIVDFEDREYDNLGCVTTGASWKFTAPRSNWYFGSARLAFVDSAAWAAGELAQMFLYKNGASFKALDYWEAEAANTIYVTLQGSFGIYLNKGDTIDIRVQQISGGALALYSASSTENWVQIAEDPDFSIFSVQGQWEILTATSATKTPSATNNYHALSGNSLTLTPGTWRLYGQAAFANSGSAAAYTQFLFNWFGANGADSSSAPAALSTVSGLTVLSVQASSNLLGPSSLETYQAATPTVVVRCTSSATVYLVSYADMTTAANARITVYANAERLQ